MPSTGPLAAAIAAAALLAAPLPADAAIVTHRSIAGVALGDSETEVIERLGPFSRRLVGDEPSDYTLTFPRRKLFVNFLTAGERAYLVATESTTQRTKAGVGPGVTARTAKRRLRGERCGRIFDVDREAMVEECVLRRAGSETTTSFTILRAKVVQVTIASL